MAIIEIPAHPLADWANSDGTIDIIRCVNDDLSSQRGFVYPSVGKVVCPDWNARAQCGQGLHGWVWDKHIHLTGMPAYVSKDGRWLVIRCLLDDVVEIEGDKVKFRAGDVIANGTLEDCLKLVRRPDGVQRLEAWGTLAVGSRATVSGGYGATVSGGDGATVSGGYGATVSGGDGATVSAGDGATVSGGSRATVSGGSRATVSAGDGATVSGGSRATVSGGYGATVSGGYGATVSGGYGATVSGGDGATVSAGDGATVSGGDGATVSGGKGTALVLWGWSKCKTWRAFTRVAGFDRGIKADTLYELKDGKFSEVIKPEEKAAQ